MSVGFEFRLKNQYFDVANKLYTTNTMNLLKSIELAISNIKKESLTDVDIFHKPFELTLIKGEFEKDLVKEIQTHFKEYNLKCLKISPIPHILFPKKALFDFRKCAFIQIVDEIKYLALVLQVAEIIERNRIKKNRNNIFSYRFLPNEKGDLFDSNYNYTAFKTYVKQQAKKENIRVVVTTDIANFYDRINLHRVESVLLSLRNIEKKQVNLINELLLFWANRDSYGLPVGSNASRILAEASLIEVDNYLISKKINFCRFVDDYRIFAPDAATAHHWLAILVEKLNKEGLFLNSNKTNLIDVSAETAETAEKTVFISKIIRGYSGLIPTKFRALSESEKYSLTSNKIEILRKNVLENVLIEPVDFVKYVKTIIAKESFNDLVLLTKNLNKFPQFFPYTLDVISKFHSFFSQQQIIDIKNNLKIWLDKKETSEFILVYLVRFFGNINFRDKEVLMSFFRNLRRNEGHYIGRVVLEELEDIVTRGEVLEIRDYYVRADQWEKRQIAKLVVKHFSDGEQRPFFKNILSTDNDIFLKQICKK